MARKRPTIADVRAMKGKQQYTMLRVESMEEAEAAELAGIDVGPPKRPIAELSGEPLLKVKKMLEGYGIEAKLAKEQ